jgi:alpha-L-arabinofuranosidase
VLAFETLTGPDLKAVNTFDQPVLVVPQALDAPKLGHKMTISLPRASYTVLHLATD